mmetsp:Transcript_26801/g.58104  ORF Transcript_26801/g.58104 Transcript_26801/m.58104 type:complete len:132 (+) Transcript_26801:211-606(+)
MRMRRTSNRPSWKGVPGNNFIIEAVKGETLWLASGFGSEWGGRLSSANTYFWPAAHMGSSLKEKPHAVGETADCCGMQRRHTPDVGSVYVEPIVEKETNQLKILRCSGLERHVQRRASHSIDAMDVRPSFD